MLAVLWYGKLTFWYWNAGACGGTAGIEVTWETMTGKDCVFGIICADMTGWIVDSTAFCFSRKYSSRTEEAFSPHMLPVFTRIITQA